MQKFEFIFKFSQKFLIGNRTINDNNLLTKSQRFVDICQLYQVYKMEIELELKEFIYNKQLKYIIPVIPFTKRTIPCKKI